jgi:hypothetical protein
MPELTINSPYVHSRVDYNTFTMGIGQPYARVDFIPSQGLWIWPLWYLNNVFLKFSGGCQRECPLRTQEVETKAKGFQRRGITYTRED